jgi:chromosome segregation ATPase
MTDKIRLDSPAVCQAELERTSNGLAQLTQEATRNREALGVIEEQLELVESIANAAIREESDTKLTAAEVKGRAISVITADERLARIREEAHSLRAERDTLERRLRTLEKRAMNAQSSLKAHSETERMAGHAGFTEGGGV